MQTSFGARVVLLALLVGVSRVGFAAAEVGVTKPAPLWRRCLDVFRAPAFSPLSSPEGTAQVARVNLSKVETYYPAPPDEIHSFFDDAAVSVRAQLNFHDVERLVPLPSEAQAIVALNLRYGRIASALDMATPQRQIDTVIYPSSGHDAGAAFALFDRARVVIGIDDHPFVGDFYEAVSPVLKSEDDRYRGYTVFREVGTGPSQEVAPATLGFLKVMNPSVRILRVFAFQDENNQVHGQIDFDFGAGTLRRTYIHIQGRISDGASAADSWTRLWWGRKILSDGFRFQGLLIKAAMRLFGGFDSLPGDEVRFLKKLGDAGGVLIDGDADFARVYDYSYPAQKIETPKVHKIGYSTRDVYLLGPWAKPGSYVEIERGSLEPSRHNADMADHGSIR